MITQENSTGRPLADSNWLASHHYAKILERTAFSKRLATINPKSVVDLGCATGLWLELLNKYLPSDCTFIGIDSDPKSLELAKERSASWKRQVSFLQLDLEKNVLQIPPSDLTLAFNIFPYIQDLDHFVQVLSSRKPLGTLAIRQYDGASLRFGPMATSERQAMELDLRVATENSQKFLHYDLDRTFSSLRKSDYKIGNYEFELFARSSPFSEEFIPYYMGTLLWTCQHVSDNSAKRLEKWMEEDPQLLNRYFYEVDLVALLS